MSRLSAALRRLFRAPVYSYRWRCGWLLGHRFLLLRHVGRRAKKVLIIGLEPSLIDFSDPAYGLVPGLNAAKVLAGLRSDQTQLTALGCDAELCLTDFGETAEAVVKAKLSETEFDCILVGAGVRLIAQNTHLFEKIINVIHEHARQAKLCFNTKPTDTAEAIQRWVKASG